MANPGFVQGVVKAGVKGGVIGVGAYSTKAGVSAIKSGVKTGAERVGEAISNRSSKGIPADPHMDDGWIDAGGGGANPLGNESHQETFKTNIEGFRNSSPQPLEGVDEQAPIPTGFNPEEYQGYGLGGSSDDYGDSPSDSDLNPTFSTPTNNYGFHTDEGDAGYSSFDETTPAPAITPTKTDVREDAGEDAWNDVKPIEATENAITPSPANNEEWNQDTQSQLSDAVKRYIFSDTGTDADGQSADYDGGHGDFKGQSDAFESSQLSQRHILKSE
jgi:hypothetical protein